MYFRRGSVKFDAANQEKPYSLTEDLTVRL